MNGNGNCHCFHTPFLEWAQCFLGGLHVRIRICNAWIFFLCKIVRDFVFIINTYRKPPEPGHTPFKETSYAWLMAHGSHKILLMSLLSFVYYTIYQNRFLGRNKKFRKEREKKKHQPNKMKIWTERIQKNKKQNVNMVFSLISSLFHSGFPWSNATVI